MRGRRARRERLRLTLQYVAVGLRRAWRHLLWSVLSTRRSGLRTAVFDGQGRPDAMAGPPRVVTWTGTLLIEPKYGWVIARPSRLVRASLTHGEETRTWKGREWIGLPSVGVLRRWRDAPYAPAFTSAMSPWPENYYHFVVDVLPKLALLDEAGMLTTRPVLVARELHESAFFSGARECGRLRDVEFVPLEGCRVTSSVTVAETAGVMAADAVRRLVGVVGDPAVRDRRIFVTRAPSRGRIPVNIAEIEALVRDAGFEVVDLDGRSFADQVELFRSATCIAAIHGAGLANLVWNPPGSVRVLELVPRVPGDEFDCFMHLCHEMGFPYVRISGTDENYVHKRAPFSVPITELAAAVRRCGDGDPAASGSEARRGTPG